MKRLMYLLVIAIPFVLAACSDSPNSALPGGSGVTTGKTACVDEVTNLEMPCDAYEALKAERQKRQEAEARADKPDAGSQNAGAMQPPTQTDQIKFFEDSELGFRISMTLRGIVEKREIPRQPWEPGPNDPNIDTAYTIGYYAVKPRGEAEFAPEFTIVVEEWYEDLLDSNGEPRYAPSEGGPSPDWIEIPNGLKGYLYLSNAMGAFDDAHITIYRQRRIYYLRQTGIKELVGGELKDFARTFEVLE